MRRLTAIPVLFLLLSSWGAPILFALTGHSANNLPACCRRNGKHHCLMSMAERRQLLGHNRQFDPPAEKCPYAPLAVAAVHTEFFAVPASPSVLTAFHANAVTFAQTQSLLRVAQTNSRRKRGPPSQRLF